MAEFVETQPLDAKLLNKQVKTKIADEVVAKVMLRPAKDIDDIHDIGSQELRDQIA